MLEFFNLKTALKWQLNSGEQQDKAKNQFSDIEVVRKMSLFLKNKATCSLPALGLEAILLGQITLSFWSVEHP